jgi:hypothetical protein
MARRRKYPSRKSPKTDGEKYAAENFLEFELTEVEITYNIKE